MTTTKKLRRNRKYQTYRRCAHAGCRHAFTRHFMDRCSVEGCECASWARTIPHRWREMVTEAHFLAYLAWEEALGDYTRGYTMSKKHKGRQSDEARDFREEHPAPKFKDFLKSMRYPEEESECGSIDQ